MSSLSARLRPFRTDDTEALVEVCTRTADSGGDATGQLPDDRLWSQIYLLPYLERHPDLAFVVEIENDDDGDGASDAVPAGYIVATDDSAAFHDWFVSQWWPAQGLPGPEDVPDGTQRRLLDRGRLGPGAEYPEGCPAHLHIDLLPVTQGRGAGRSLMERLCAELAARGVTGVHATAGTANAGALAFYPRVGFEALPAVDGGQTFVRRLAHG
ncbi:GNAT family N-acetyltransferase [Salana multivorans]